MTKTRTRSRPATNTRDTETRSGGVTTSSRQETRHRATNGNTAQGSGLLAYVSVKDGVTLNMTDFNSFRRDVGVELPVDLGDLDTVLDDDGKLAQHVLDKLNKVEVALAGWVADKLDEAVVDATEYFQMQEG